MSAQPPSLDLVLFGGTFDPVHNGHLEIARAAADLLHPEKVLFIPAANPPHKNHGPLASFEDRVAMLTIACAGSPCFEVSRIEAGAARSYSIDTIERLNRPTAPGFLIGADAFAEIETWHRWRDVVAAVTFIVVARPGAAYKIPPGATIIEIPGLHREESSSGIRRMIAEAAQQIPVPAGVLAYIHSHALYRSQLSKISQTHTNHSI